MPVKAYLYCANAKPYLTKVVESGRYSTVGKKDMRTLGYATEGELKEASLNGTVCFECDCKEAFDISKVVQTNKNLSLKIRGVYDTEEVMLYRGR